MNPTKPSDDLITYRQAAEILGCSLRTVCRMGADEIVKVERWQTVRGARRARMHRAEIEELAQRTGPNLTR